MINKDVFSYPVVMVSGNTVKKYYTTINATLQDGFSPLKVLFVCTHSQKTHKGKVFRFASKLDIEAYKIMTELFKKEG